MVNILLYSKDLVDVASFLELLRIDSSQAIIEKGRGEVSATFRLVIKKNKLKLKQDLEYDLIKKIVSENEYLKKENAGLQKELEKYQPKQDLNINETLKSAVEILREEGLTFDEIANRLNEEGYTNSRGNTINKMLVIRLYKKYKEEEELNV